jgi:hypothetical protein
MRFTLLLMAVSALVMAFLAWVTHPGQDSHMPTASPASHSTPAIELKSEPTLLARLAEDPHAALEWLRQTSGGAHGSPLSTDAHLQSAVSAAADRLIQMTQSPAGKNSSLALENFIQLWAMADVRTAYEWVHQIPAGEVRDALMVRIAFAGSRIDPAEAACLVVEELPPGTVQEEAAVMVLHQWALQDAAAAAAWVGLFPEDSFRERLLGELRGIADYHRASLAAP